MSGRSPAPALPVALAVLALTAGCIGGLPVDIASTETPTLSPTTTQTPPTSVAPTPTGGPESTPEAIESQSLPWKPDPLVAGNVEVYVREYERTIRHNELVGSSVITVEQTCQAALVAEIEAGYLVRAECGGSVHERNNEGSSVGAMPPERVTYFVNDSRVTRIPGEDRELDPYRVDDEGSNIATPEGLAMVNADDVGHELQVEVSYDGDDSTDTVLDEPLAVGPGEGVDLERVAGREGVYNVTVVIGNETTANYRWQVENSEIARPGGVGVVITPSDEVVIAPFPRMQ